MQPNATTQNEGLWKRSKSLFDKLSKSEAWETAKPWLETAARSAGVKSLYDVPEYFRERLELRGLKIGNKSFGGGLAGTTAELLEQSKQATQKKEGIPSRNELYTQLTKLEQEGKTDSEEYKRLEDQLETGRPTAVREKIAELNKKLSLTKEGEQKNSEARKKLAQLLREQRRAEKVDRQAVNKEVTTVLNDYTNQKVDGVTAARESLRTVLMASGAGGLMTVGNAAFDAAQFVQQTAQAARRDGEKVNTKVLAKRFGETARGHWNQLKGKSEDEGGSRVKNSAAVLARLAQSASKYGVGGGASTSIAKMAEQVLNKSNTKFNKQPAETFETPTLEGVDDNRDKSQSGSPSSTTKSDDTKSPEKPTTQNFTTNNDGATVGSPRPPIDTTPTIPSTSTSPSPSAVTSSPNNPERSNQKTAYQAEAGGSYLKNKLAPRKEAIDSSPAVWHRNERAQMKAEGDRVRNVNIEERNKVRTNSTPGHPEQTLDPEHPDIARKVRDSYKDAGIRTPTLDERPLPNQPPKDQTRAAQTKYAEQPAGLMRPGARTVVMRRRLQKKGGKKASPLARLRVTGVNFAILAWGGFLWITFQIPFAIMNILLFSVAAAISYMTVPNPNDNILWAGLKLLVSGIVGAAKAVADAVNAVTGIDITGINPGTFWLLTEVLLICYGLFILLVIFLQYKLAFLRPLSGKATGLKFGAFLLALIGYSIPVLNLFPWFLVWTIVVWIYPK